MVTQYDSVTTRDQLGRAEDKSFFIKKSTENIIIEEGPTLVYTSTLGNSWIVGSSTNGIVGTNTSTQGGGQQVVGASGRVTGNVNVVSPNSFGVERFTTTYFNDTGVSTCDWGVTAGQCDFTNTEIAQSLTIAKDGTTWTQATLYVSDDTNLTLYLSADGGFHWEEVSNGVLHSFVNTGTDLRFKLVATGVASITFTKWSYN